MEEKTAAPAKGGKPGAKPADDAKPEVRMITPDPVLMTNESGRTFEFELGRFERKQNEASSGQLASQEDLNKEDSEAKWVTYRFNQHIKGTFRQTCTPSNSPNPV